MFAMNMKTFAVTAALVFFIITILHVLRLILGWQAMIGGWDVPLWISWLAVVLFGYLGYTAFKLSR
jgi:hypothetical protein